MKNSIFAVVAVLAVASFAMADVLLEYQTAPSTSNPTLAPSFEHTAVSGDQFVAGAGVSATSGSTYNFNNWADGGVANATAAAALAENEYFRFGFDVTAAYPIDLTEFEIRLDRSSTGPNKFEIEVSVNGAPGINVLSYDFGDNDLGVDFLGISLAAVPTLNPGDSVEFTVVPFGADSGGASAAGTFDLETIDFGGADPRAGRVIGIPEPASLILLALGTLLRRR